MPGMGRGGKGEMRRRLELTHFVDGTVSVMSDIMKTCTKRQGPPPHLCLLSLYCICSHLYMEMECTDIELDCTDIELDCTDI